MVCNLELNIKNYRLAKVEKYSLETVKSNDHQKPYYLEVLGVTGQLCGRTERRVVRRRAHWSMTNI